MKKITRKAETLQAVEQIAEAYRSEGLSGSLARLEEELLRHKVKFPQLERAARALGDFLPEEEQVVFCNRVAALQTIGGNVIIGILLQERLDSHFEACFHKAAEYIAAGEQWYVCDIIGERVYGYALLHWPARALPALQQLSGHSSYWVVRSLGAGSHYAIKKGLDKAYVLKVFDLLLTMCDTHNKEVRQGVGWAAKTTAKFHPDIIEARQKDIQDAEKVPAWFRTKIKIGLARHQYAQGDKR